MVKTEMVLRWISIMQQLKCVVKENTRFCLRYNNRRKSRLSSLLFLFPDIKVVLLLG
jgi:hypothetical protein